MKLTWTVMPGLADMHVHLMQENDLSPYPAKRGHDCSEFSMCQ